LERLEKLGLFYPLLRVQYPPIKIKVEYTEDRQSYKWLGKLQPDEEWRGAPTPGVRVTPAPVHRAGRPARDVLKAPDARKALADRARWRADERRWVRAGKLPRPGWLPPQVPASPAWTAQAPQRAAEQAKLAAKRAAAGASAGT
jgi:hypothetical protein